MCHFLVECYISTNYETPLKRVSFCCVIYSVEIYFKALSISLLAAASTTFTDMPMRVELFLDPVDGLQKYRKVPAIPMTPDQRRAFLTNLRDTHAMLRAAGYPVPSAEFIDDEHGGVHVEEAVEGALEVRAHARGELRTHLPDIERKKREVLRDIRETMGIAIMDRGDRNTLYDPVRGQVWLIDLEDVRPASVLAGKRRHMRSCRSSASGELLRGIRGIRPTEDMTVTPSSSSPPSPPASAHVPVTNKSSIDPMTKMRRPLFLFSVRPFSRRHVVTSLKRTEAL